MRSTLSPNPVPPTRSERCQGPELSNKRHPSHNLHRPIPRAGYEKAHVAVYDATRLAEVKLLPDKQKATRAVCLVRTAGSVLVQ
jgi:hypothetical protein